MSSTRPSQSVSKFPGHDGDSGWVAPLPPRTPNAALSGPVDVDYAVIGAGFTGLAMARRIHQLQPDATIALVDAGEVGSAASGRSSGVVLDLNHRAASMDPAECDAYVALSRSGIGQLRTLVDTHSIDCDWDENGWFLACVGDKGLKELDEIEPIYRERDYEIVQLDRDGMQQVTGTPLYQKGLRFPGYPLVQAAALVRGLADNAPAGTTLYENTPISAIDRSDRFTLTSQGGTITAAKVFLATNGYTFTFGVLPGVIPLFTYGSMTRPLTDDEQQNIGGESEWGLVSTDPMGSSVRRTRDQRILIRNTVSAGFKPRTTAKQRSAAERHHRRALIARFPQLANVPFEQTWAGLMGVSANSQPAIQEVEHGVYCAAGYTATGIALGTGSGTAVVDLALGNNSDELRAASALKGPSRVPPEPFRSLGGTAVAKLMNRQAADYV